MTTTLRPPTIPGSLDVDTLTVNNILDVVGTVVGDALSTMTSWKKAVDAASTANLTLSGEQTVDGVALVAGDRILVKDQTEPTEDGIYVVQEYAWVRSDDMLAGTGASGFTVRVNEGTVNGDVIYVVTNAPGADIVGTSTLVFSTLTGPLASDTVAANAVTVNGKKGLITTGVLTGAQGATLGTAITVTNSEVAVGDLVIVWTNSYGGPANSAPVPFVVSVGAGSFVLQIVNAGSAALNALVVVGYQVIKGF